MSIRAPMSKTERQRLIETLVEQREVSTQRELVHALGSLGCGVTQATVSRDIRELDLQKVRTHLGRARYVHSSREHPGSGAGSQARHARLRALDAVAQQLVVVRCEIGTASTVARQIDNLNHTDIIGTLAGDDTFLVIVADAARRTASSAISTVSERPSAQAPSSAHSGLAGASSAVSPRAPSPATSKRRHALRHPDSRSTAS